MHLVRLMRMAGEILSGQGVKVRRPDAEELLAIRGGAWSFEKLETWAQDQDAALVTAYQNSRLPHEPDRAVLNLLLVDIVSGMF